MRRIPSPRLRAALCVALVAGALAPARIASAPAGIAPASLPRVATVDERFQSYNIEMAEVMGGWFWRPYGGDRRRAPHPPPPGAAGLPAGMDPAMYRWRAPIDLSSARLRRLAAALGPAYVRVSGTWANTAWFHDSDDPPPKTPPPGFGGVLTRAEWKGVVEFARAVNGRIMTSFATSPGTHGPDGVWTPGQARRLLAYTRAAGGSIAAAEFMNEPNAAEMGGAAKGYDAAAYGRDVRAFRRFIDDAAPDMLFLGPGSVGEGGPAPLALGAGMLKTLDLLTATGPAFDVFSYHLYAAVSRRCAGMGAALQTTAEAALSDAWLSRPDGIASYYAGLRDRYAPGKPLWITETADAACGGNPWAATFLDTFRYVDSHARLARQGVALIAHNTLAASDYGLLDPDTLEPRPNYWAALLWARLMGATVLDAGRSAEPRVHLYAHCLRDHRGGVALLAINLDRAPHDLRIATPASRYTLTAARLLGGSVRLNGRELRATRDGDVPALGAVATPAGRVGLPATSITFLAIPEAGNHDCE